MFYFFATVFSAQKIDFNCVDVVRLNDIALVEHIARPIYKKQLMCFRAIKQNTFISFSQCSVKNGILSFWDLRNPFTEIAVRGPVNKSLSNFSERYIHSFGKYFGQFSFDLPTETRIMFDVFNPPFQCDDARVYQRINHEYIFTPYDSSSDSVALTANKSHCIFFSFTTPQNVEFTSFEPNSYRTVPGKNPRKYVYVSNFTIKDDGTTQILKNMQEDSSKTNRDSKTDGLVYSLLFQYYAFDDRDPNERKDTYYKFKFYTDSNQQNDENVDVPLYQTFELATELPYTISALAISLIVIFILIFILVGIILSSCCCHKKNLIDAHLD